LLSGSTYSFVAPLWQHDGAGGWHFLTVPSDLADEIRSRVSGHPRPFGTVRAVVTVGSTTWATSLFADRKSGSYLLPVNARVRRDAGLFASDRVACRLELIE
jgi:hypothetical protein